MKLAPRAENVIIPGPPPVRRMIDAVHVADRGTIIMTTNLKLRYLTPLLVKLLAPAVIVVLIPSIVTAIVERLPDGVASYGLQLIAFLDKYAFQEILGWAAVLLWLVYVPIVLLAVTVYSRMNSACLYEYGMEVSSGAINRSKKFIWYYQITESPTYVRTLRNYLTHTASLKMNYDHTASTTERVELIGIGTPKEVDEVREYLQSRILPERLPIRGPWT